MREPVILNEAGVDYIKQEPDPLATSFKPFKYTKIHIPTETIFHETIWCWSVFEALTLINHWNRSEKWKFILTS